VGEADEEVVLVRFEAGEAGVEGVGEWWLLLLLERKGAGVLRWEFGGGCGAGGKGVPVDEGVAGGAAFDFA